MKQYLIGFDTETCNSYKDEKGKDCLMDSLVYDIGWQVTDRQGNVYLQRSFVVSEIFNECPEIMAEAHFKEKIPQYYEELASGARTLASIFQIRNQLLADMKEFNINIIFAHNVRFDINALNKTLRYITSSNIRYFFNKDLIVWDTMLLSNIVTKRKSYENFCRANGFMTNHPTPRVQRKAETLYSYINKNPQYEECHTGLEDVEIETQILAYCFKQHKKMEHYAYKYDQELEKWVIYN